MITKFSHPLVKHLINIKKNSSPNNDISTILITGEKLCSEICSFIKAENFIVSIENKIPKNIIKPKNIYYMKNKIIEKISGLNSIDGYIAEGINFLITIIIVDKPNNLLKKNIKKLGNDINLFTNLVIFDQLTDPGNKYRIKIKEIWAL
jgi:hypothetical protein